MADREAKLAQIREQKNRWMRERNAEIERQRVVAELVQPELSNEYSSYNVDGSSRGLVNPRMPGSTNSSASQGPTAPSYSGQSTSSAYYGANVPAAGQRAAANDPWASGVRPEEVIDKLTERIADRLRSELRVELQKESENWQQQAVQEQQQLDGFLAKELETQNTCPICYDLMVPPEHAPQLLFPCGHTFCAACLTAHVDRHKKSHCPVCRKKIESRAPNYSLQQLILNFVSRKDKGRGTLGGGAGGLPTSSGSAGPVAAAGEEAMVAGESEVDRLRRQAERMEVRLKVLNNELIDTIAEEGTLEDQVAAASNVMEHLRADEAAALRRLAAVQAELELVRQQISGQQGRIDDIATVASHVASRRQLLCSTIQPLQAELEKLHILMEGAAEQQHWQ